jgi:hypothetical protein
MINADKCQAQKRKILGHTFLMWLRVTRLFCKVLFSKALDVKRTIGQRRKDCITCKVTLESKISYDEFSMWIKLDEINKSYFIKDNHDLLSGLLQYFLMNEDEFRTLGNDSDAAYFAKAFSVVHNRLDHLPDLCSEITQMRLS